MCIGGAPRAVTLDWTLEQRKNTTIVTDRLFSGTRSPSAIDQQLALSTG
jgi:hypothetical protein